MRLRPLELARPIVLVALVVSLATAWPPASVSAQQWPERRGQGVCYSQLGWCPLDQPERIPPGTPCYCILSDRRTISGIASPLYYQGRVNPYFNLHPPPVPTQIK
jgi:hypothetical protein